jgi:predicted alpha/beta superfamily hydrolase
MAALAAAQMEMSAIVSENRITAALTHNVPSSVDRTYEVGEEVLVFREKEKMDGSDGCGTRGRQDYNRQRFGNRASFSRFIMQQIKPFLEIHLLQTSMRTP